MKIKSSKNPTDLQLADLKEQLARSRADYANLEKRTESQRQLFVTLATVSIISKMVEVLDDLTLAQSHLQDTGLKMTLDKFMTVLKSEGLEEINPKDSVFDHQTMECVGTTDGEDNRVVSVHKIGYSLNGQVIRPAQVIVGKLPLKN